jgi:thiol:disulfide interchange protein DsbD
MRYPYQMRIPTAILIFFALPICGPIWSADPVVSVRAIAPAQALRAGEPAFLTVELAISDPYHINSNRPLQDYLIPTTLEFEPHPDITIAQVDFPPAPVKKLPVLDTPMAVFEGIVRIKVEIIPASDVKRNEIVLRGNTRYQACDDISCFPPVRQAFSVKLPFGDSGQHPSPAVEAPLSLGQLEPTTMSTSSSHAEKTANTIGDTSNVDFDNKGLLVTFSLVFLGGLALNLTPCVYPLIPITITYFGGQAQGKKGSLIAHSFLYVIGMAVTYSVLGVTAALTGGLFGAAYQYPPVLIAVALIMVLLALSMFDVYEFRMPRSITRLAGSQQRGFWGTFLMGLTVGIVAAPCIGPFVFGLLTYVGNKANPVIGFLLFFVLALGLGIPFLVLGIFSGNLRRLPRSGAWMVWVRKIFGFILLAMGVYFIKTLLPNLLWYHSIFALVMLLAGVYMAWIEPTAAAGKVFPLLRNIVGIIFFIVALYAATTGAQAYIETKVSSEILSGSAGQDLDLARGIRWLPYSEEMLGEASRQSIPVFIDFYADWCAPCKELDKHTFSDPEIAKLSREFMMLKADLTSSSNPQTEALREKYQALGVPTLVFLKPDGQEIPDLRVTGFETKEDLYAKMNRALKLSLE